MTTPIPTDPQTACTRLMELIDEMGESNKAKMSHTYKTPERRKSFVVDQASYTKYLNDIEHLKYFDPQGLFVNAQAETKKIGDIAIDIMIQRIESDKELGRRPIPTQCLTQLVKEAADFVERVNRVVD